MPSARGWRRPNGPVRRGSPAVLHAADDLALEQHGVGDGGEGDDEHDRDLEDRDEEEGEEWSLWAH